MRFWSAGAATLLATLLFTQATQAQTIDLGGLIPDGEASTTGRIVQLVILLTVLSIAPGIMIMVTSFTRIIVALSFLRSGIGLQSTPANLVLISLALFMTFYVMAPTFDRAWQDGMQPLLQNEITEEEAYQRTVEPFREFMQAHVREQDLAMFVELAEESFGTSQSREEVELRVLIPAFMISELRRGFEIGLHHRPALPRDRYHGGNDHHVHGHDDDAAHRDRPALQDPVLHPDRRLEPARRRPDPVVLLANNQKVFSTTRECVMLPQSINQWGAIMTIKDFIQGAGVIAAGIAAFFSYQASQTANELNRQTHDIDKALEILWAVGQGAYDVNDPTKSDAACAFITFVAANEHRIRNEPYLARDFFRKPQERRAFQRELSNRIRECNRSTQRTQPVYGFARFGSGRAKNSRAMVYSYCNLQRYGARMRIWRA